nr:MAG TPA: hypothetical protein [Caudoviricetes sp.]
MTVDWLKYCTNFDSKTMHIAISRVPSVPNHFNYSLNINFTNSSPGILHKEKGTILCD